MLPHGQFEALAAGGGGADESRSLRQIEHTWRLLTMRVLLDLLGNQDTGPLGSVTEAWDLLARAHSAAPDAVHDVVMWPPAGIWAGYTIRRLRRQVDDDDALLWMDVGYLHALAAAGGIRAGLTFDITLPVRFGCVVLPSLGYARLAGDAESGTAVLTVRDGQARLAYSSSTVDVSGSSDAAGWHPLHRIESNADGAVLRLTMNDSDTYRGFVKPEAPDPLSVAERERWETLLGEGWRLLVRHHSHYAYAIGEGLVAISPLRQSERFRPLSASADQAFGAVQSSEPEDAAQMAVTLIHEYQHNKLGALLHLLDLYADGASGPRIYAPWRDDPRPFGGVLQGVYAFVGITDFWRVHRTVCEPETGDADLAHFEFALWRDRVSVTLTRLHRDAPLTAHGSAFVTRLRQQVDPWIDAAVPESAAADAQLAADDHYALWVAYHRRPDPGLVARLVKAWSAGSVTPDEIVVDHKAVEDDPRGRYIDARSALIRLRLADPSTFKQVRLQGPEHPKWVTGAQPPDVFLVAGELGQAKAMYLARLAKDGRDAVAWTGLGWALRDEAPKMSKTIQVIPDLLRAVYAGIPHTNRPDPLRFVTWMGLGLPTTS